MAVDAFVNTRLDVWGVLVEVSSCQADARELEFFFGRYLTFNVAAPDVSVSIECLDWPSRGVFASSLCGDGLLKQLLVADHHDDSRSYRVEFSDWSGAVSPFPPFGTSKLSSRLAVCSGAVVRGSNGVNLALIGNHYVGKTSVAVDLCRSHRAELISDSLIVIDVASRKCLTYQTPLGFRRDSLISLIPLLDSVDYRLTVSKDTGLVALIDPLDVLGSDNAAGGPIDVVVHLSDDWGSALSPWVRRPAYDLGWYTDCDIGEVVKAFPEEVFVYQGSSSVPLAVRASEISDLFFGGAL